MTSIWWIRRDFRLSDNPALVAAAALGAVVPVFVCDETVDDLGAAPKWRMGLGLAHLIARIEALGGRVILRSGAASEVLLELAKEVGAKGVYWNRLYDKAVIARDTAVKSTLKTAGIEAQSSNGHLCFEPWTVETKTGGYYKVYTPFWKTVRERDVADVLAVPKVTWPQAWPESEALSDWQMGAAMQRGAKVVLAHCHIGEEAALARLDAFIAQHVEAYKAKRDFPAEPVCSGLSENLTYGEISPRRIWHAGWHAMETGAAGAEHFLKELVWREFAYHLLYHEPDLPHRNHREGWDGFEWRGENDDAEAWRRGRTGVQFVDAAMREMYVTGVMHNRARMIVASFLTKHLLTDWRIGRAWFEDCLIDWDPAANAMGWQWVAGCGPDAAPYFRVFNPDGQAEKFDADGAYMRAWIAEEQARPSETSLSYFAAVPKSWDLSHQDIYPEPIIGLKEGRERALAAYARLKT
ncbi:cryptochrome/photolyase family protein [Celeribacter baekdonensis]|uniref:Deoxyribodipyrimidine photolyase n=1 Tax=Celeribacter baekdonensis TaxID=875171 RepID=A0A2R4M1E4_9RHOB|nr:deoxyribodipyrimidine photo-lyase [Celeribacter baekdonensis]AVW90937.1 deoxyribodipyrimidine photolyase [Celeribacter baekdonensis]